MTHEDKGHYAKKHPSHLKVNPEIVEAVKAKALFLLEEFRFDQIG
jgi:hypothetical protein